MKQIIRIEANDGLGMFVNYVNDKLREAKASFRLSDSLTTRHWKFNTPEEDGLEREKDDFCAFKSIEQIQQWIFPDEFEILFDNGYKVYLIEVSQWKEGDYQILYKKENIISKKDISSLFISQLKLEL